MTCPKPAAARSWDLGVGTVVVGLTLAFLPCEIVVGFPLTPEASQEEDKEKKKESKEESQDEKEAEQKKGSGEKEKAETSREKKEATAGKSVEGKEETAETTDESKEKTKEEKKPGILELLRKTKAEKEKKEGKAEKEASPFLVLPHLEGVGDGAVKKALEAGLEDVVIATELEKATSPEGGDDKPQEAVETTEKKANKKPLPPMFWMRDGTRLAGYPDLNQLHVKTAYGDLTIPVSEVEHVRFVSLQKKELLEEVDKWIQQLAHEEFDLREQAMEELRQVGTPALDSLRKAVESEDEEVKSRAQKLLEELEEDAEEPEESELHTIPLKGDEDEVKTRQFTIKGQIQETSFTVKTRYGELTFQREDIISVVFQEPLIIKRKIEVPGASVAGKNQWVDTKIDVAAGETFEINASGTIVLQRHSNTACGPNGAPNVSKRYEDFAAGALVAKLGDGKPFAVNAHYNGKAEKKVRIFLAIALKKAASGNFEVEIETANENAAAPKKAGK